MIPDYMVTPDKDVPEWVLDEHEKYSDIIPTQVDFHHSNNRRRLTMPRQHTRLTLDTE